MESGGFGVTVVVNGANNEVASVDKLYNTLTVAEAKASEIDSTLLEKLRSMKDRFTIFDMAYVNALYHFDTTGLSVSGMNGWGDRYFSQFKKFFPKFKETLEK